MNIFSILRGMTIKLQKQCQDILAAYELTSDVQLDLELLRANSEEEFHIWFQDIKKLADDEDIAVVIPKLALRQASRSNTPADSPEVYFRQNVMIPFLDYLLSEMEGRFGSQQQTKIKLLGLIPSISVEFNSASIDEVGKVYQSDLPCPQLLPVEFRRWKTKFALVDQDLRLSTLLDSLQSCDPDSFPNIRILLAIACTLPITTCENKRSNSQLKLLKSYLRSTMSEERLSELITNFARTQTKHACSTVVQYVCIL